MIFLGDIAHPFRSAPKWGKMALPWYPQYAVANLEGALVADGEDLLRRRVLFNDISVLEAFNSLNVRAVSLANNHVMDIPNGVAATRNLLERHHVRAVGAGRTAAEAATPAIIEDTGRPFLLMGFGWETIRCRRARTCAAGVNPLLPSLLLRLVEQCRRADPQAAIVVLVHWNYEMEPYPQPAHRQLAMAAINAGASAVIGHHPHCVGGLEMYMSCPIAYSLGNWWLPQGVFFNGRLSYSRNANLQLALEWSPGQSPVLHWFEYHHDGHRLVYLQSETESASQRIQELTPFRGMSHHDYVAWFRENRVKRKALPIYRDYRHHVLNWAKDIFVRVRHVAVMGLEQSGARRFGL